MDVLQLSIATADPYVQVTYFALQMMTGPSELEAIAGVNTTNDAFRRALIGQGILRLTIRHRPMYPNKAQHQQILLQNATRLFC